ncbi:hypothetical protein COV18_06145 [Candidatus Woesearchaeota archaeon CG10_big_fil_rev_8_21_14_0_10_37_12]|nr:MAG: hypothetical protein COV18_06145 [Candidatus Woesearchaeota archaeon CG10_big_fil_rev_8_21_14_0_10_37_12]
MKAVILSAGRGKRLESLTNSVPKAMILINNKPMLQILIEQLKSVNVTDICIVVHYLKDKLIDYFKDGKQFGVNITYAEQTELAGNADALLKTEQFIKENRFFCIACDSLFETSLLNRLLNHKSPGVFTCKKVENPTRYGILVTESNKVKKIVEKPDVPPTNLANFSVWIFPKEIFDACKKIEKSRTGEYWVTDAIQLLINNGFDFEYEISKHIIDIGTKEQLEDAQKLAKQLKL